MRSRTERFVFAIVISMFAGVGAMGQAKPHGPFTAKDWSELRSAHPVAVSTSGTILYSVTHGGEKGPTRTEWWTAGADGSSAKKLRWGSRAMGRASTADGK